MMRDYLPILLLAVAGFCAGGVYALWKTVKLGAIVLAMLAIVAGIGGVMWMF